MSDEPLFEKMSKASAEAVGDLIRQHWPEIERIAIESGKKKAAVGLTIKFERIGPDTTKVKTSIRYASKHSDEREDTVDTPDESAQGRLPLKREVDAA